MASRILRLALFGAAMMLTQPAPARAAVVPTFTVDSFADDSDAAVGDLACRTAAQRCTLRAALEEADKHTSAILIVLPAGTYRLNRQLVYDYWRNPAGGSPDFSDGRVEIQGAGEGQTIIDGQSRTRVFYLRTRGGRVTLRDLTITRGKDTRAHDATNEDRPGFGAGIFVQGLLDLERVTLTQNEAQEGGGLYVDFGKEPTPSEPNPIHGIARLFDVTVTGNRAIATRFGFGGGGIANGSELFADRLVVAGNHAESQGGGIYNNSWYWLELHHFEVSDNVGRRDAGGIQIDIGKARLFDGGIRRNRTQCCRSNGTIPGGAGLFSYGLNEGGRIVPAIADLTRVVVADNVAEGTGGLAGGIYNWGHMTLREVSVIGNRASYGAGIYSGDPSYPGSFIAMHNTTISGNTGKLSEGQPRQLDSEGAGFMLRGGSAAAYNSTITENAATVAGGISNRFGGSFTLASSILAQNVADWSTDCWGLFQSGDHNVIGDHDGTAPFPCAITPRPSDAMGVDARLGALSADALPSHPPSPDSPAVDREASSACPDIDAVGMARPQGQGCDSGAREHPTSGRTLVTGQKKCWDAAGALIDCGGTGHDGSLRKGLRRRYVDNVDGTVTDLRTGLVWEKLDDTGGVHDKDASRTWAAALTKIGALNSFPCFAGHCDWRLPNANELESLIDYGRATAPVVGKPFNDACTSSCAAASCSCTAPVNHWSSTSHTASPTGAWTIDFATGQVARTAKSTLAATRAVRGGP